MNWEDWPPLSTQPIGLQSDGAVVMLYPPDLPEQLVTIAGGPSTPPVLTLGVGEPMTAGEILPQGWNLFIEGEAPQLIDADGTTTAAPADGDNYPITVS